MKHPLLYPQVVYFTTQNLGGMCPLSISILLLEFNHGYAWRSNNFNFQSKWLRGFFNTADNSS